MCMYLVRSVVRCCVPHPLPPPVYFHPTTHPPNHLSYNKKWLFLYTKCDDTVTFHTMEPQPYGFYILQPYGTERVNIRQTGGIESELSEVDSEIEAEQAQVRNK
uniref:Uncharacterized protein n=1 Tax=Cacopsylla melanoneura TaxID=428564 RepID=A0A8D8ZEE9_9HEMI